MSQLKHTRELRLFLSSTFVDLMPEREQLIKKTFPRIRAACRARGVEFTEIDLRWGITQEESRTGKTIRICLEEIDRCRPYFIGILGSRYGWVPGLEEIEKDPALLADFPWLREFVEQQRSIIDMEFSYGAIARQNDSAFFYATSSRSEQDSVARLDLLDALALRLEANGLLPAPYASPEELGEMVYKDIMSLLDRDWPIAKEASALELARLEHASFARNRRHSYVADPAYYETFKDHIQHGASPLIIAGSSGLGKSALMAYLAHKYSRKHPDVFVIEYYVGATDDATAEDVIRHILLEIADRLHLTDEIPSDDSVLRDALPRWFAKLGATTDNLDSPRNADLPRMVIFIDALNQLTGIGPEMHWLPEYIPPGIQLILSTTPEAPLDAFRERGWKELEMRPLSVEQARKISVDFLSTFRKSLPEPQLQLIAHSEKSLRPLFLRTLLEELRVFGRHEEIERQLWIYLSCEDERELFQRVLARLEQDHGVGAVRSVMTAIWAARYGLSEREIMEITSLPRMKLSELLLAMEYHLMKREELFTFFHQYLREGVRTRYLLNAEDELRAHALLGEYFARQDYTLRRRDEEPWQWQHARDWERYRTCLTDVEFIVPLLDESHRHQLLAYWLVFQEHFSHDEDYHKAFERYEETETDLDRFAERSERLGDALMVASRYREAEVHLAKASQIRLELFGDSSLSTAQSLNTLATLCYHLAMLDKAVDLFRHAIAIREELLGRNDASTAKSLNDLAATLFASGQWQSARDMYTEALESYTLTYKSEHTDIADILNNLGTVSYTLGEVQTAVEYFSSSLTMFERLGGRSSLGRLRPLGNLALSLFEAGRWPEAEDKYDEALHLSRTLLGESHSDMGTRYANLAHFFSNTGRNEEAIERYQKALSIRVAHLGEMHNLSLLTALNLSIAYLRAGNLQLGNELRIKYMPLEIASLGLEHPTVVKHLSVFTSLGVLSSEQAAPSHVEDAAKQH